MRRRTPESSGSESDRGNNDEDDDDERGQERPQPEETVSFLPPDDSEAPTEENERLLGDRFPPTDSLGFVCAVFFMLGMGTLLPWNFFISVNSFWDYKFRDVNGTDGGDVAGNSNQTVLQEEFTSYLAIASNIPNAIFVILNAIFGQRIVLKWRIFGSLGLIIFFFMLVTIFARTDSDLWQTQFLQLMLALVVLINICTAIYQGGVFGVAGKFPPVYMGAVMAGQAMGGIFPALVDILVISVHVEEKDVGFACFLVATLFLVIGFVLFALVRKTRFFIYYAEDAPTSESSTPTPVSMRLVLTRSWVYCLGVFVTFATTLAVFPAITVLIESQYKSGKSFAWADKYFTPVTCFLVFNCGDYLGRMCASAIQWPNRRRKGQFTMLGISLARICFIPLFMFCNAAPTKRSLPVLIHSDALYILIMGLFALSNGYLGNICMLHGPKTSSETEGSPSEARRYQEATAMTLVACLVLGTGFGSFVSYGVVSVL